MQTNLPARLDPVAIDRSSPGKYTNMHSPIPESYIWFLFSFCTKQLQSWYKDSFRKQFYDD